MGHRPIQKTDGSARTEAGLGFRRLTGASLTPFPTEAIYEPSQERQELFMVVAHDFVTQCLPSETRRDEGGGGVAAGRRGTHIKWMS